MAHKVHVGRLVFVCLSRVALGLKGPDYASKVAINTKANERKGVLVGDGVEEVM